MAVAIATTLMAERMSDLQECLDISTGGERRYQIQRACVYATYVPCSSKLTLEVRNVKEEALNWQADPDDVQDDLEVLHHLQQLTATVPFLSRGISGRDHTHPTTTLVTSVQSPSFAANTRGRLLPSFHRYSLRSSSSDSDEVGDGTLFIPPNLLPVFDALSKPLRDSPPPMTCDIWDHFEAQIVWKGGDRPTNFVFTQFQLDVVDLFSRRSYPTSRPAKRRRTAVNPFLQVSDSPAVEAKSRGDTPPHEKRYNGVRPYRRQWEARMKPPKFKDKQYFGTFKVEAQAALAVDAAFHHYGRPDLLNFPDSSPQLLAARPAAATGLDDKAKLQFVKGEAKWLASMATEPPLHVPASNRRPVPSPQPSASSRGYPSPQFRSFSEVSWPLRDCGGDEADDAVSQQGQGMQLDSLRLWVPSEMQSEQPIPGELSSEQITEQNWDWAEGFGLAGLPIVGNSNTCEMQSPWLDSLLWLPPASTYSLPPSPRRFEDEKVLAWLERQSC